MPFRIGKFLPHLNQNEQIYLVTRKHWIIPSLKTLFWLIIVIFLLLIESFLKSYLPSFLAINILEVVRSALLMFALLGLFIVWTMYYLNVQVITNERIIDINQKSLLHHATSELGLERVQDVTTEIKGVLGNLLDFGNVKLQTAGEEQNFIFDNIARPHQVAKIILELYDKVKASYKNEASQEH